MRFSYWGQTREVTSQIDGVESTLTLPADWVDPPPVAMRGYDLEVCCHPGTGEAFFNDLCNVVIFHFVDVMHKDGNLRSRSCRRLVEAGFSQNGRQIDCTRVHEIYTSAVQSYGICRLGDGWIPEWDYWGARCICYGERTKDQRKDHVLAGDVTGCVMYFTCMQAMVEYMDQQVRKYGRVGCGSSS